jgi:hypothetical protein
MRLKAKHPAAKYLAAILLASLLFPFIGLGPALAQSPIQAEVDRAVLSTDEMLTLTVTLDTSSILDSPNPLLPDLEGFQVVGSNVSTQIQIIGTDILAQAVYVYLLQPYWTGDLTIGPISVTLGGQTYSTQPVTVHVTQGAGNAPAAPAGQVPAAPQPGAASQAASPEQVASPGAGFAGQDFYVEAEVDLATPYVGQQVVHTFRFYRAGGLWSQPQYQAPTFTGFWTEGQPEQHEYRVQAAGRTYDVVEVRTLLFPSVMGPVTIDPAQLTIPGDFFSPDQTLQTQPVELHVQPLPPGAPTGFNGAVGRYSLSSSIDSSQGTVGEPLAWHVTLSGQGNLTAAPDPTWPEMPGWRGFDNQATVQTDVRDGQAVGSRTYERLLVPTVEGESAIPALEYVYLNPQTGQYETSRTEPIPVSIAPGAAGATANLPAGGQEEAVEQAVSDIRHLKLVPAQLSMADQPVTRSTIYWAAWAVPALGALGYFTWQRRQRHWENNANLARSSQARKKAKAALARARRQGANAYGAAGQILITYLSDKLDRPLAGLTHQALAECLAERGVDAGLAEQAETVLVSSEMGRFAPGADDPGYAKSLLLKVGTLIDALEKVL